MSERIRDIDPSITVKTYETFVLPENLGHLLDKEEETGGKIDYIVDAIDTVSAKIALAEEAQRREIRLISSMGTGNKLHRSCSGSMICQRQAYVRFAESCAEN